MTDDATTVAADRAPTATVPCPHCDRPVHVSLPNREADPTVRPYPAAFGDHTVVRCAADHKVWVYYC